MVRLILDSPTTGNVIYWMGRPHWSQWYAFEAIGMICTMHFVDWGLEEIEAHCFARNVRSITLLDRLGFQSIAATRLISPDPLLGQEVLFRPSLATFTCKMSGKTIRKRAPHRKPRGTFNEDGSYVFASRKQRALRS